MICISEITIETLDIGCVHLEIDIEADLFTIKWPSLYRNRRTEAILFLGSFLLYLFLYREGRFRKHRPVSIPASGCSNRIFSVSIAIMIIEIIQEVEQQSVISISVQKGLLPQKRIDFYANLYGNGLVYRGGERHSRNRMASVTSISVLNGRFCVSDSISMPLSEYRDLICFVSNAISIIECFTNVKCFLS